MTMVDVNHHRSAWHAYGRDRAQRRQDHVAAVSLAAGDEAQTPAARVHASERARIAAQAAFDEAEPEMSYEDFVLEAT